MNTWRTNEWCGHCWKDFKVYNVKIWLRCLLHWGIQWPKMSIDELQSSLLVHEHRISRHVNDEQELHITHGFQQGGRGGGTCTYWGWGWGRGRFGFKKSILECYYCHELGHFNGNVLNKTRNRRWITLK